MSHLKRVDLTNYTTTINIGAGIVRQICWYLTNIILFKNPISVSTSLKVIILRLFGACIGKGVIIKQCVNIKYPWKLQVGNNCWIGEEVWIDNLNTVVMGDNVVLSQGALIMTGTHDPFKTTFDFISSPVIMEDGTWIGAKAVVYGGVTCRSHCILGLGGVAESDMQEYTIYKGNPAVPILKRTLY